MEIKQNPFSVYDFLGYLIPGGFLIYGVSLASPLFGLGWPRYLPSPSLEFFRHPDIYIPFAIVAYILGHALSFLSSVFVERYALWSLGGYPSKRLLGGKPTSYFEITGEAAMHIKKRRLIRGLCWISNLPFSFWDTVLERYLKFRELYARPLDKNIVALVKRKMWIFVGREIGIFRMQEMDKSTEAKGKFSLDNCDYFRPIYHYVLENFPNHTASLKNYVALYGFLRTMTFLFTAMFWLAMFKFLIIWRRIVFLHAALNDQSLWPKFVTLSVCVVLTSIAAFTFYMAFGKFYRRFSLEALMAFAANYHEDPPDDTPEPFAKSVLTK